MNKKPAQTSDYPKTIKTILKALNLTQVGLASKMGVSQGIISEFASGAREPSKEFMVGLAKLGISLDWFLTGEGSMFLQNQEGKLRKTVAEMQELGDTIDAITSLISAQPETEPVHFEDRDGGLWLSRNNYEALERNIKALRKFGLPKSLPVYQESELPEGAFVVPLIDQRLSAGDGSYLPEEDEVATLIRVPAYLSRFGKNIAALTVDGDSMYPTLSRGDMVVCDSCGWSGDGVYGLRMSGSGLVKRLSKRPGKLVIISDNPKYQPYEEPEDSQDIQIIGRVHCAIKQLE